MRAEILDTSEEGAIFSRNPTLERRGYLGPRQTLQLEGLPAVVPGASLDMVTATSHQLLDPTRCLQPSSQGTHDYLQMWNTVLCDWFPPVWARPLVERDPFLQPECNKTQASQLPDCPERS